MSDVFENLAVEQARMRKVLDAWQSEDGDALRTALTASAAATGALAAHTDAELHGAITAAANTQHDPGDAGKAEAALAELHELNAELVRRYFPHGVDYEPPAMMAVGDIDATRPRTLLRCDGERGALLTAGEVCLLSGAGGVGKSTFALEVAFAMACGETDAGGLAFSDADDDDRPTGAPAVYASAEDAPWAIKRAVRRMATSTGRSELPPLLHHVDLSGRALFAPPATAYNEPPAPTVDWHALWRYVAAVKARLVVIDPVMAVYAGNENRAVEVRMFISEMVRMAREHNCGVLVLAHSTKAARGKDADPFDAGHVAGSASWTDGVRGALALAWGDDSDGEGRRVLKVLKANYGRVRIQCLLSPRREDEPNGRMAIIGFDAVGGWQAKHGKVGGNGGRGRAEFDDAYIAKKGA